MSADKGFWTGLMPCSDSQGTRVVGHSPAAPHKAGRSSGSTDAQSHDA